MCKLAEFFNQCPNRPFDILVKQWLEENDIKEKAYYYWLRKFQKEAYAKMQPPAVASKTEDTFAEGIMPLSSADSNEKNVFSPAVVIKCSGLTFEHKRQTIWLMV